VAHLSAARRLADGKDASPHTSRPSFAHSRLTSGAEARTRPGLWPANPCDNYITGRSAGQNSAGQQPARPRL